MEPPFLYKDKEPLKIRAEVIFSAVKAIIAAGEEEKFLVLCREKDMRMTAEPELVNLVKSYLFDNGVHKNDLMAHQIVTSAQCP